MTDAAANQQFCLRCQALLQALDEDPRCGACGLQFDPANPDTYSERRRYLWWRFWFPGFCLAVVSGVISYAICLQSGELGLALFCAVPVSVGAIVGYSTGPKFWLAILLAAAAIPAIIMTLVSLHLAGFFCGLTLGLIFWVPTLAGVMLGVILRVYLRRKNWDQRWFFPILGFILLPYVIQSIENARLQHTEVSVVRTAVHVQAAPREAWNAILFYEDVQHPPPWLLRLALPKPIASRGSKHRPGSVVHCQYDRGWLVKRISSVEPDRQLSFEVIEQKLHFERDVTLRDGSFKICRTASGGTKIELSTRYERHLSPRWLWQPLEHQVVHTLHSHVLEGMKRQLVSTQLRERERDNRHRYPPSGPSTPLHVAQQERRR